MYCTAAVIKSSTLSRLRRLGIQVNASQFESTILASVRVTFLCVLRKVYRELRNRKSPVGAWLDQRHGSATCTERDVWIRKTVPWREDHEARFSPSNACFCVLPYLPYCRGLCRRCCPRPSTLLPASPSNSRTRAFFQAQISLSLGNASYIAMGERLATEGL